LRKTYVELLDAEALGLLVAIFEAGGAAQIAVIEQTAWEHVVLGYGYDPDDSDERAHVVRLVDAGGPVDRHRYGAGDGAVVTLSRLGSLVAGAAAVAREDD